MRFFFTSVWSRQLVDPTGHNVPITPIRSDLRRVRSATQFDVRLPRFTAGDEIGETSSLGPGPLRLTRRHNRSVCCGETDRATTRRTRPTDHERPSADRCGEGQVVTRAEHCEHAEDSTGCDQDGPTDMLAKKCMDDPSDVGDGHRSDGDRLGDRVLLDWLTCDER